MSLQFRANLLFPVCVMVAAPAAAQEGGDALDTVDIYGRRERAYTVEEMSTATKLQLSPLETPQSVSVITGAQLEDFALLDVNDALETATGISVEQVETDRTYYTARGFDITNFQVDGVGVPVTYGNVEGDVDTAIYERIEIVRGATSLMAGAGNPSATVNMVRKRPTESFASSFALRYGSWDEARVEADVSAPLGERVRGRLVAAVGSEDSYLRDYSKDRDVYYGVMEVDITERSLLGFGYSHQRSHADSPMWGAFPLYYSDGTQAEYDVSMSTAADWTYWNTDEANAFVDFSHQFVNGWTARATYMHTEVDSESELFYMYGAVDPVTHEGLTGWASAYELEDERDLVDVFFTREVKRGQRSHQFVIGANWSQVDVNDISLYDYTTGNGFPAVGDLREWTGSTPHPTFADGPEGSDFTDEQLGFYAAGKASLTDSLSVVAGARVLEWDSVGESYSESQEASVSGEVLPYFGAVYDVTDALAVYASYTESFMPQSEIDENFLRLAPARGSNTELGVKAGFNDDRLVATLAVFEAEHDNVAEYLAWIDGFYVYEGKDFSSSGAELDVAGEFAPGLQASFGFTYLDIEDAEGESARRYVPKQMLRVAASYSPPRLDRLRFGASVSWQGDVETADLNYAAGVVRQESYALVRLFAGYRFTDRITARLNVNNLTDEKYLQSLYWDQNYYGAPRNASLAVTVRF